MNNASRVPDAQPVEDNSQMAATSLAAVEWGDVSAIRVYCENWYGTPEVTGHTAV